MKDGSIENRFGALQKVGASSTGGWTNETSDFTPWLAENLELLGQEIGLALEFQDREHPVGRYSLDLLLRDEHGRNVVVENQFGHTDHDHLGKLLTYCAGTKADVVVWISETINEEHIAALEWLNENTVEGVGFFGVELELLRIDDSLPAPHFKVIVRPNEWVKRTRPARQPTVIEWSWEAYESVLGLSEDRIEIGRELGARVMDFIKSRDLPWEMVFRKGYVAFQRRGGYNVVIVDLYWSKPPRLAIKLPDSPEELSLKSPYGNLHETWSPQEREWGWTVPTVDAIPDVEEAISLTIQFQPEVGPMIIPTLWNQKDTTP